MTKTSMTSKIPAAAPVAAVPDARRDLPAALPAWPGLPSVPWELTTQALTLQSALWMGIATLQAQWLAESIATLGRLPGWAVWHNGLEQLA